MAVSSEGGRRSASLSAVMATEISGESESLTLQDSQEVVVHRTLNEKAEVRVSEGPVGPADAVAPAQREEGTSPRQAGLSRRTSGDHPNELSRCAPSSSLGTPGAAEGAG